MAAAESNPKRTRAEKIVLSLVFVVFLLYALSLIFPFVWAMLSSLKTDDEYYERVFALPRDWLFVNFIKAFDEFTIGRTNFAGMFANSLWLTFSGTFVAVMVSSATSYVIAKYNFKGNSLIYKIAIFTMIIPIVGNLPSMYKLVVELNLNNPVG